MSNFDVVETTIEAVHKAFQSGQLTPRELVQAYIDRIEAYDKKGPALNCIITVNPNALEEADRLGASPLTGPLHGIPIVFKDQGDAKGMPTTLGSVLFKDYYPDRDCFVVGAAQEGRRHHPGQGHPGGAGRRRYPRLAVRVEP